MKRRTIYKSELGLFSNRKSRTVSNLGVRHPKEKDLKTIAKLNNTEQKFVGHVNSKWFERFLDLPNFWIVEDMDSGLLVALLLAMDETTQYDSPNFLWFRSIVPEFIYIDRVVVDPLYRNQGIATRLYRKLFRQRKPNYVCEVSLHPLNLDSIPFHSKLGFIPIGIYEASNKRCIMYQRPSSTESLIKQLP